MGIMCQIHICLRLPGCKKLPSMYYVSCISIPAWSPPCVVASSPRSLAPCPRHRESWNLTRGTTSWPAWAASSVQGQRCDSENYYDHFYADTIFGSYKSSRSHNVCLCSTRLSSFPQFCLSSLSELFHALSKALQRTDGAKVRLVYLFHSNSSAQLECGGCGIIYRTHRRDGNGISELTRICTTDCIRQKMLY